MRYQPSEHYEPDSGVTSSLQVVYTHASDLHALSERLLVIRSSAANQGDGIEKHIIHLVSKNSSTVPQELKITPFYPFINLYLHVRNTQHTE